MYRKIQKETFYPNGHDYLHLSELPEKILYENNDFCHEFQVKVLHITFFLSKEMQCVFYDEEKFFLICFPCQIWKWQKLFRWNMYFRGMFLPCTLMFSITRCSKVFLFCAIWGTAVWFACFSTEIFTFKKKDIKIFAWSVSTNHAKTKQKKTVKNSIQ